MKRYSKNWTKLRYVSRHAKNLTHVDLLTLNEQMKTESYNKLSEREIRIQYIILTAKLAHLYESHIVYLWKKI